MENSFSSTPRQAPDEAPAGPGATSWDPPEPLSALLRRVLGVLMEKALTTPDQYPLTANATVTGCNQKSNRDPQSNHPSHMVDEALLKLKDMGLSVRVLPVGGRTERWKHSVKDKWGLDRADRAVLAELLLRGPQAEGEMRARASRMAEIPSLEGLRQHLEFLENRGFVKRLSPKGQRRGVIWTHLLYPQPELDRVLEKFGQDALGDDELQEDDDTPIGRPAQTPASAPISDSASAPVASSVQASARPASSTVSAGVDQETFDKMSARVQELENQVAELRDQLEQFQSQYQDLDNDFRQLQRDLGN